VDKKSGRIIDASDHFDDMMMLEKKDYLSCPMSFFTAPSENTLWSMKPFGRYLLSMEGRHEDVLIKGRTNRTMVADVHISRPLRVGAQRLIVCLITDETERHRLQSELISKHKELRKTFADLERQSAALARLNMEMGEMSARLSHASSLAAVGEITAELTHQLNNPLAGAVSAARRIDMFLGDNVDARVKAMMPLLRESLERLRLTMTELKRVYRNSRSADAPMEPVDLKMQIDSALMLMQQRLGDIELQLDVPGDLTEIVGRPPEIQNILVHLIDNAIHAAGERGIIRLKAEQKDAQIVFTVGDSGPGIPEDRRERIFEPFFTTKEQGFGLGLSVVRRNVQNNKAAIRIGQSPLGGAAFEIGFAAATR
jgi:C4-dicarboxylate-specific signal transduction histidine kinase